MSLYAYRDQLRINKVFAKYATADDKSTPFFCENPNCNAKLYLEALNSKIKTPYFSAKGNNNNHIENCYFSASKNPFKETQYNEFLFNFEAIVNEYINGTIKNSVKRLDTISQIYYMCKSKKIDSTYNEFKIWEILCDIRSNYKYSEGILGNRLIECQVIRYDSIQQTIFLRYPFNKPLDKKNKYYSYQIKIIIKNKKIFNLVISQILTKQKKITDRTVIVLGKWIKISNYYSSYITEISQIFFPQKF